jgi:hypothetical protein
MFRAIVFALLLAVGTVAGAAGGVNIYLDIDDDITHNQTQAPRLKLKKQKGLDLGRMAGVWGRVGKGDAGDAFFLGKTPVPARMQFRLAGARDHAPVKLTITARDGSKQAKHQVLAQPGETAEQWLVLKGRINVLIESPSGKEALYASYFWYPGDRLDGLSDENFNRVQTGSAGKVSSFARRKQGRAGR